MKVALLISLALLTTPVLAHNCPLEMNKIDQALLNKPNLSSAQLEEVKRLRAEGARHHRENRHGEAMLSLGSAKKILGIE